MIEDLAVTARDLRPILREFREPFSAEVRRLVDAHWNEIVAELALHDEDEDIVVVISETYGHTVVARSAAVARTFPIDLRIADWLAHGRRQLDRVDLVVEMRGVLSALRVEHRGGT